MSDSSEKNNSDFLDEYLLIRKNHPGEVIHIMYHLVLSIDVVVGDIPEVKFFTVKQYSGYFFLSTVFTHDFKEDGAIAMQDFIDTL